MPITAYKEGRTNGFLHQPSQATAGGVVLTHGAGLNCESPLLLSLSNALCEAGFLVLRCNLQFREKRAIGPPSPAGAADDRAGLREAVLQLGAMTPKPISLGGHSYGARQSSILMTEPNRPHLRALILLSYPLHPPRKPEQLRSTHFGSITTPSIFIHGTRDPFGSPGELASALTHFPSNVPAKLLLLDGLGHELSPKNPKVASFCAHEFLDFLTEPLIPA